MKFLKYLLFVFLFTSLAIAQDAPIAGARYLGSGANADVYMLPGNRVQKIFRGGAATRDLMVDLTNTMASRSTLIPALTPYGQNSVIQNYVGGKQAQQLISISGRADSFVAALNYQNELVGQALREIGNAKAGGPLAYDEVVTVRPGLAWLVDSNMANFRFDDLGRPLGWFDPFFIMDQDFVSRSARSSSGPVSILPIDQSAPTLSTPPPDHTLGLKQLRTYTFVNAATAVGDLALTYVDYSRAMALTNSVADRNAVSEEFLNKALTTLKVAIGGTIIIAVVTFGAPLYVTAAVTAGFIGLGVYGFGTHLTATFGNDMLDFLEQRYGEPNLPNDINHPRYVQMRKIQKEELQLKLKAIAQQRQNFNGVISAEDIQRLAVLMDRAGVGREVTYGTGYTRSAIIAKENQLFALYADLKQTMKMNLTAQQKQVVTAKRNEVTALVNWLNQASAQTGQPVRLHRNFEAELAPLFQALAPPPPPPPPPPVFYYNPTPLFGSTSPFFSPPLTNAPVSNIGNDYIYATYPQLAPPGYSPPVTFSPYPAAAASPLPANLAPGGSYTTPNGLLATRGSFLAGTTYTPGHLPVNLTNVYRIGSVTMYPGGHTAFTYFDRDGNVIRSGNVNISTPPGGQ